MMLVPILLIVIGLGIFIIVARKNVLAIRVPSQSMLPTLNVGSEVEVILDHQSYVPHVGDIVLFHPPTGADPASPTCGSPNQGADHPQACDMPSPGESSQTFIKRVVAGPGDTVAIIDGHVYRNGVRENDPYIEPCGTDSSCNFPTPIVIPPGYYFMLGDNRGASDDSRFWGPVPRTYIAAQAVRCSFFDTICNSR